MTSPGWKELGKWGIKNGSVASSIKIAYPSDLTLHSVVGLGYEEEFGPHRRLVQHAL